MSSRSFVRLFAISSLLALSYHPASAQPSHFPAAEQWYNYTDDGHRQYVYEMGVSPGPRETIVVLHGGWGAEHSYLLDPLAPLAERHRLVFYDQRGSLLSPAPDSTISLDRLVLDLEDLRRALGLEQMTLLAHSMGNGLAYAYLARFPERVRGLVLVAPVHPAMFSNGPNLAFAREVWPEADSTAMVDARSEFFEEWGHRAYRIMDGAGLVPDSLRGQPAQQIIGAHTDRDRTRAWRITFASVNSCTGERWRDMQGGQVFYDQRVANAIMSDPTFPDRADSFWPALRSFDGPVQVIIGTCDYVDVGPLLWPRVAEHLRDGSLTVVEGAGHSLWMDKPDVFKEVLFEAVGNTTD